MPARHTPTGVRPDLDGARGNGPLYIQGAGEPYLYDYANKSVSLDRGLFAKLIDGQDWALKHALPTTRIHSGTPVFTLTGWVATMGASTFSYVAAGGAHILFPLDLDHQSTLQSVSIGYLPPSGHAAFPGGKPATMPNFDVIRMSALGVPWTIGTAIDASATAGAYEAAHTLTLSGLSESIDITTYTYWLYFQGETGANAIVGTSLFQPKTVSMWP